MGSSTLTGLSDVDDSNLGDGRFLRYNATEEEFTFEPVSATNLELIAGDIQSGILTTSATGQATVMSIVHLRIDLLVIKYRQCRGLIII